MTEKMVQFNALITPEQNDILHYICAEYKQKRCEALRGLIEGSEKVAVIRRRLKEEPGFPRCFAKRVLESKGG